MSELLLAAYLGVTQGLTEFLPVSSSGHLVLSHVVFERYGLTVGEENLFFDVLLHLGTLAVVLLYYRKELFQFVQEWTGLGHTYQSTLPRGMCRIWTLYILASTAVTTALALPFEDQIEEAFSKPLPVGFGLLLTGTLLLLTRFVPDREPPIGSSMSFWKAVLIGAAQAVAVIPGVSRSGTTIAVALLLGVQRAEAVTFSFLLSIPAILGGALLTARKVDDVALAAPLIGMLFAAIFGWLALALLVKLVLRGRLLGFAIYCYIVGLITIALSWGL